MNINHTIETEVELTPEELAEGFWSLDSNSQARFFNHLGKIADHVAFINQMFYVREEQQLTDAAKARIATMHDYLTGDESKWN